MQAAIIIPARYASSRLPGKPLLRQTGKYLVQHVYEGACAARHAGRVIVATPIRSQEQWQNPNCVKVVCDVNGRALYFSRSPIPFVRDGRPAFSPGAPGPWFLQHLGLYAYRREFLLKLAQLPPHPLEELERLEQLRVLAAGQRILVGIIPHASIGVDTYEDY